jgi:hypothetical protein
VGGEKGCGAWIRPVGMMNRKIALFRVTSVLKMEAAYSFETCISAWKTAWCYNQKTTM